MARVRGGDELDRMTLKIVSDSPLDDPTEIGRASGVIGERSSHLARRQIGGGADILVDADLERDT